MKVSIIMMTYNHENYIEKAINGVLMQETNFDFELIVSNDFSVDSTDRIIKKIIKTHPFSECIKYNSNKKNIGMQPNFIKAYQLCKGKYIALCEGDDYWIDPLKLQKQVDVLEGNTSIVISSHNSNVVDFEGEFKNVFNEHAIPEFTDANYILNNHWYMSTASIVFRKGSLKLPEWFTNVKNGDYTLYLLLTCNGGLVHYANDVRSAYRLHEQNISHIFKTDYVFNFSMIYINRKFNIYSNKRYYKSCSANVEKHSFIILKHSRLLSKRFWTVLLQLVWFKKGVDSKIIGFLKQRLVNKTK